MTDVYTKSRRQIRIFRKRSQHTVRHAASASADHTQLTNLFDKADQDQVHGTLFAIRNSSYPGRTVICNIGTVKD